MPARASRLQQVPLDTLRTNPDQPRKTFNEETLAELAASIEHNGLIQPIVAVENGDGFTIVAGERRYRAVRSLDWKEVSVLVIEEGTTDELALVENVQREDLHPLEEAEAMQGLIDRHRYTHDDLANVIGKARSTVTNTLRLNELPDEIKNECTTSHVVPKSVLLEIVRLPVKQRLDFWEKVKAGALTVKKARATKAGQKRKPRGTAKLALRAGSTFRQRLAVIDEDISPEELAELQKIYAEIGDLLEILAKG